MIVFSLDNTIDIVYTVLEDRTRIRCRVLGVRLICWGAERAAEKLFPADSHPGAHRAAPPEPGGKPFDGRP